MQFLTWHVVPSSLWLVSLRPLARHWHRSRPSPLSTSSFFQPPLQEPHHVCATSYAWCAILFLVPACSRTIVRRVSSVEARYKTMRRCQVRREVFCETCCEMRRLLSSQRQHNSCDLSHQALEPHTCVRDWVRSGMRDATRLEKMSARRGVLSTKSAMMVFGPRRDVPSCSVHLGSDPLPVVMAYTDLGVILTPTLSWTAHARHLVTRGNPLFSQCVARCRTEGLSCALCPPSSPPACCPASLGGLSFLPPALREIDSALRRWGRFLPG